MMDVNCSYSQSQSATTDQLSNDRFALQRYQLNLMGFQNTEKNNEGNEINQ